MLKVIFFILFIAQIYCIVVAIRCLNLIIICKKLYNLSLKENTKSYWLDNWKFNRFIFNPLTYYMCTTNLVYKYLIKKENKNEK
jgi:hypothetical protein